MIVYPMNATKNTAPTRKTAKEFHERSAAANDAAFINRCAEKVL
jgi:hypothetical protein